jgi:hypothetical protein
MPVKPSRRRHQRRLATAANFGPPIKPANPIECGRLATLHPEPSAFRAIRWRSLPAATTTARFLDRLGLWFFLTGRHNRKSFRPLEPRNGLLFFSGAFLSNFRFVLLRS